MYLLYSFALFVLFVALLPYFIYQAIRHGKYSGSFRQRMGHLPQSARSDSRPTIWVHTVSVGEFNAARPLACELRKRFPDHKTVISTTTLTGQRLAQSRSESFDAVFYFPFDLKFSVRRALDHVKPDLVIIFETELWPNFLRECRRRGIKTVIANGRISAKSFRGYLRARRFIGRVIRDISLIVMQSDSDAERMLELGAQQSSVIVCGNMKYDVADKTQNSAFIGLCRNLDEQFALSSSQYLIVAGSTAPGEEKILLEVLRSIRTHASLENARLLIAPRHPERFEEVARLIKQSKFSFTLRSIDSSSPGDADVILLDTIGELDAAYRFATVVFVGGSLVARGGHNILEAAAFAKPVIVGPHMENFRAIVTDFINAEALIQMKFDDSIQMLVEEIVRLLSDSDRAEAVGARAREILLRNRGATLCTVEAIQKLMNEQSVNTAPIINT